jgi:hypothetical protein
LCARARAVGRLKKSRRNRGALHGDFHISEANIFANPLLPSHLDCDSFLLTFLARKGVKDLAALCCEGVGIDRDRMVALGLCRARDPVAINQ